MFKIEQEYYETIISYLPKIAETLQEIVNVISQKTINASEQKESNNGPEN